MQSWPPALESDRQIALASLAVARSLVSSPAGLGRAAAAFYDCQRLCLVASSFRVAGGRWSRRLVALREQIKQAAETGLAYVDALRADPGNRAAAAGVVEMLAMIQFLLTAAGQGLPAGEF